MANFNNYEVLLSEVELDACADELSKECAALVLEEPFISTVTMPINDVVDAKTVSSVTTLAGSHFNTPMPYLKNQNQNMEEEDGENVSLDKEANLGMQSMNGKEVADSYFDYRGGTGVFIPKATQPLKRTSFPITKPDLAYDHQKKKGEKKKKQIYIKKKKDPAYVTLPQEWPYEQYSQ